MNRYRITPITSIQSNMKKYENFLEFLLILSHGTVKITELLFNYLTLKRRNKLLLRSLFTGLLWMPEGLVWKPRRGKNSLDPTKWTLITPFVTIKVPKRLPYSNRFCFYIISIMIYLKFEILQSLSRRKSNTSRVLGGKQKKKFETNVGRKQKRKLIELRSWISSRLFLPEFLQSSELKKTFFLRQRD